MISQPHPSVFENQHVAVETQQSVDKAPNFGDLIKPVPPFKDYINNLYTYQYLQQLENPETMQPKLNEITQQYSSSTDEGCETDLGGKPNSLMIDFCSSTTFIFQKWTKFKLQQL